MEDKQLEQPIVEESAQSNTDSEKVEILGAEDSLLEGSIPSKFKSTESLVEAYENLQVEFTRKSQKLSEVSRQLAALKENAEKKPTPFYEAQNYEKEVQTFFHKNPSAKEYASEISELVLADNAVVNEQPLDVAWTKILANKFLNFEDTIQKDTNLLERIIENKTVQENIIKKYLQSIRDQKTVPVISTHNGSGFSLTPKQKPINLDEAKALAEALFKI